jgi:hypothetical protein
MRILRLVALVSVVSSFGIAQEGHPLTGTWHGDWTAPGGQKNRVVMFMKWDTKNIVGTINPGRNAIPMSVANLDATNWTIHIEGDGKDSIGKTSHIVIDGKLENIGSYNRTITGTWNQGGVKGDLKVTRD